MVKGIKINFNSKPLEVDYIAPTRTQNMVIFSNNKNLLLWEPDEIKSTKTEMKQYVSDIAKELSNVIGPTILLTHGRIKYDWVGGKEYDVKIGTDTIAKVVYDDDEFTTINTLDYRPKYDSLKEIPNFI